MNNIDSRWEIPVACRRFAEALAHHYPGDVGKIDHGVVSVSTPAVFASHPT
jgi:hypothetical protein